MSNPFPSVSRRISIITNGERKNIAMQARIPPGVSGFIFASKDQGHDPNEGKRDEEQEHDLGREVAESHATCVRATKSKKPPTAMATGHSGFTGEIVPIVLVK